MEHSAFLADEAQTVAAGCKLGKLITLGSVVFLQGTLGAGKTTFTRGILAAFGHSGAVKSPTYTLVEPYEFGNTSVFHFDLYRLGDPEELEYLGIRDYFTKQSVAIIEWPSRGEGMLPQADLIAEISPSSTGRILKLIAHTQSGQQLVQQFAAN